MTRTPNPVREFIPVARVADMLLHPGEPYDYNGERCRYPHVRLAYWVGGNPFHHHQDLNRLRRAVARLDTFVVHDPFWTATARHADIVLPSTTTLEREDIGASGSDPLLVAMKPVAGPQGGARDDYAVLSALADRLESDDDDLTIALATHITADEIDALTLRVLLLAETATMPMPPGHRPIPWPPF